jgi:hypothetical protein
MIGRLVVSLGTGSLLAAVIIGFIAGKGQYPRTGDVQLIVWLVVLLSSAVAGYSAGRISASLTAEPPLSRAAIGVILGLIAGCIAGVVLYGLCIAALGILLANSHLTG